MRALTFALLVALAPVPAMAQTASPQSPAILQLSQRLDNLELQMQQLTGMVEKNQFQTQQLQNRLERLSADLEVRFDQLAQQRAAATPAPAAPDTNAALVAAAGTDTSNAAPAPAATATPAAAPSANPQELYDAAFAKLRAADYAAAEQGFAKFLAANPTHALAGNAQYWLGETFYVRGNFQQAAVAFAEGYQKYPKNSKAPDNLLKLAMALGNLNAKDDACTTLAELRKSYPNSPPTIRTRADQERVKLGCK